jgi:formate hydrogenlyase subunit 4
MSVILSLLTQIFHTALMVVAAPSVAGVMNWLDAWFGGRAGPTLGQPWRDLLRLSRKTPVTQESVSVVSRVAPAVSLGAMLAAAALVPSFTLGMALSPLADVLVVVSLMTVGRVACSLVALDSGAALPGLAVQESSARAILAEPALMLAVFALAPTSGSFSLDTIIGQQHEAISLPTAASAVTLCALLILVFAGANDLDWGNEQMLSGTDLAIVRMGGWIRRLIWIDLVGGMFLPVGMAGADSGPSAWLLGLAFWALKLGASMLILSCGLNMLGRLRRGSLQEAIGVAALLALLATIMVLASTGLA